MAFVGPAPFGSPSDIQKQVQFSSGRIACRCPEGVLLLDPEWPPSLLTAKSSISFPPLSGLLFFKGTFGLDLEVTLRQSERGRKDEVGCTPLVPDAVLLLMHLLVNELLW